MAKNDQPQTPAKGTQKHAGGRPARTSKGPVGNLQYAMDRANVFIADGPTSVARRARACARAGVPKETVLKALAAIDSALVDCRKRVDQAYAAPEKTVAPASRVNLQ